MAKLNEGDVIEGIFTIALSLHLAYGKVEKNVFYRKIQIFCRKKSKETKGKERT
jgi:hypothetical protein